jgi:hypothetical protein
MKQYLRLKINNRVHIIKTLIIFSLNTLAKFLRLHAYFKVFAREPIFDFSKFT